MECFDFSVFYKVRFKSVAVCGCYALYFNGLSIYRSSYRF